MANLRLFIVFPISYEFVGYLIHISKLQHFVIFTIFTIFLNFFKFF
jgi:hypothetical protein